MAMRFVRRTPIGIAASFLLILTSIARKRSQTAGDATAFRGSAQSAREKWPRDNEVFLQAGIAPGADGDERKN